MQILKVYEKNILHQSNQKFCLCHVGRRAQKFPVSKELRARNPKPYLFTIIIAALARAAFVLARFSLAIIIVIIITTFLGVIIIVVIIIIIIVIVIVVIIVVVIIIVIVIIIIVVIVVIIIIIAAFLGKPVFPEKASSFYSFDFASSINPWTYHFFGCCALTMTTTGLFR
jgi:uncharacterized membrane protein